MLALLLQKLEIHDKALLILDYMRDLAEDTNNNYEAMIAYEETGKMY